MNRLGLLFAIVILLLATNIAQPEVLVWHRSADYDNNSLVPPEKVPDIRYNIYYGDSLSGPWNLVAQVSDNSLVLPDSALPAYGGTRYYTGDARLDNSVSGKGEPLQYTRPVPPAPPAPPSPSPGCAMNRFLEKI